jgi:hypothetical protein
MSEEYRSGNVVTVRIELDSGAQFIGKVNMIDYHRFSDFIENHADTHVKFFDVKKESDENVVSKKFILIPKSKIIFYEPLDDEKR